tara:strand:+ start:3231 stop:3443 length:213 start_codon:yes stop_codon:yes gene_type:complete
MTEVILVVLLCMLGATGLDHWLQRKRPAPPPPPDDVIEETEDGLDEIEADIAENGSSNSFRRLLSKYSKR